MTGEGSAGEVHGGEWGEAFERWRTAAEKALRGEPLEALDTHVASGFALRPLHGPAPPAYLGRPTAGPWAIVQRIDGAEMAAQAREDLANGASELSLVFAGAPSAYGRGLAAADLDALDATLDGVFLDLVPLHIEAGSRGLAAFALVLALAQRRGHAPAALHAGIDPVGVFAADGSRPAFAAPERLAEALDAFEALGVPGSVFRADGRVVAEAGGTPATELAFALHSLARLLRRLDGAGVGPDRALPRIAMALSASQDQFATIAKMRAARRLFAMVAMACGVDVPLTLHATGANRMLSHSDPHTNLLRLTLAAFSAGVGGADAVALLPFEPSGTPFARRMARNVQSLLVEESHLGRIADPGAGAGAVEAYTDALGEAAWALFQEMEADEAFVSDGRLAERVTAEATAEHADLEAGERVVLGVTLHPPQTPQPVEERETPPPAERRRAPDGPSLAELRAAAADGATLADLTLPDDPPLSAPPLRATRAAAPFGG